MALTIYTWENKEWVPHSSTDSLTIEQSANGINAFVANVELISGSIQIVIHFIDSDIPNDKQFKFCQLNSVDEVDPIIINIVKPDSLSIPIPNECNYDIICIDVISTAINETTECNIWLKPVPKIIYKNRFLVI